MPCPVPPLLRSHSRLEVDVASPFALSQRKKLVVVEEGEEGFFDKQFLLVYTWIKRTPVELRSHSAINWALNWDPSVNSMFLSLISMSLSLSAWDGRYICGLCEELDAGTPCELLSACSLSRTCRDVRAFPLCPFP